MKLGRVGGGGGVERVEGQQLRRVAGAAADGVPEYTEKIEGCAV